MRAWMAAWALMSLGCGGAPQELESPAAEPLPALSVSTDGRHLVDSEGNPFLWIGDTAWQLFVGIDREEAARYLRNRREKGFNVIQAVALAEYRYKSGRSRGLGPNHYGQEPLVGDDPTRPAVLEGGSPSEPNDYWDHVDHVLDLAEAEGLYVALLPCWGVNYVSNAHGADVEIFDEVNARTYGEWIGKRYGGRTNIVWVVGGDDDPLAGGGDFRPVYRAMAEGIATGVTGQTPQWDKPHEAWDKLLMTFHPRGGRTSSEWFHEDAWLDFNMLQTGHRSLNNPASYQAVLADRELMPIKPVIDGEPCYEDHPAWQQWRSDDPAFRGKARFGEREVRQAAYWSMLSGAAGHTYGHHAIWQMYEAGDEPINFAEPPWQEALDRPGAASLEQVRRIFTARTFARLEPDPTLVVEGERGVRAARVEGSQALLAYFPGRFTVRLRMDGLRGDHMEGYWVNAKSGASTRLERTPKPGEAEFTPPDGGSGDWVLVLDVGPRPL